METEKLTTETEINIISVFIVKPSPTLYKTQCTRRRRTHAYTYTVCL